MVRRHYACDHTVNIERATSPVDTFQFVYSFTYEKSSINAPAAPEEATFKRQIASTDASSDYVALWEI